MNDRRKVAELIAELKTQMTTPEELKTVKDFEKDLKKLDDAAFAKQDLTNEIWRDIAGFNGDYQESNYGRTKSFKRGNVKILKPSVSRNGYLYINLKSNGVHKRYLVHRLVAILFIPNPDNKPQVNHIDGNKQNNRVNNLEWVTSSENITHAYECGLQKYGEQHHKSKLTIENVRFIRNVYVKGDKEFGARPLARRFGVSQPAILSIINGETYKNVI